MYIRIFTLEYVQMLKYVHVLKYVEVQLSYVEHVLMFLWAAQWDL